MGKLKERMGADLRLRNLAARTQEAYLRSAERLAAYHMRSPAQLSGEDIRQFLIHLQDEVGLKPSSLRVHMAGLKFLYRVTLRTGGESMRCYKARGASYSSALCTLRDYVE